MYEMQIFSSELTYQSLIMEHFLQENILSRHQFAKPPFKSAFNEVNDKVNERTLTYELDRKIPFRIRKKC